MLNIMLRYYNTYIKSRNLQDRLPDPIGQLYFVASKLENSSGVASFTNVTSNVGAIIFYFVDLFSVHQAHLFT
jgi:hypothetical protein